MIAHDVVSVYLALERRGVRVWIDGGWAVDALLGRQTRAHADFDIAVQACDLKRLRLVLEGARFHDVPRDDTRPWNFVLGDDNGRLVDIHVITLFADGSGQYGPPELGESYPAGSLDGRGSINGQPVRCIAPEYLVAFHTGYTPRASDIHDVALLCAEFRIPFPEAYLDIVNGDGQPDYLGT